MTKIRILFFLKVDVVTNTIEYIKKEHLLFIRLTNPQTYFVSLFCKYFIHEHKTTQHRRADGKSSAPSLYTFSMVTVLCDFVLYFC